LGRYVAGEARNISTQCVSPINIEVFILTTAK
jgi:hypothetical protein